MVNRSRIPSSAAAAGGPSDDPDDRSHGERDDLMVVHRGTSEESVGEGGNASFLNFQVVAL